MTDVLLLNLPFVSLARPSAALGLLHGLLEREGMDVESWHANMIFAEMVGPKLYCRPQDYPAESGLGDWVFVGEAFPEAPDQGEEYFERFWERFPRRSGNSLTKQEFEAEICRLRAAAPAFLDGLVDEVLSRRPRLVGCTSTFQQHVAVLAFLRRLRKRAPEIVNVIGGANCESVMGLTTHRCFPWVDYVVSGEADDLIAGLAQGILGRGRDIPPADLPAGVVGPMHRQAGYPRLWLDRRGEPEPPRAMAKSLRDQPLPDYDDYFKRLDRSPQIKACVTPTIPLETSRGCWWGSRKACNFCGLNGRNGRYTSKPAAQVLGEMTALSRKHGLNTIETVDNIMDMKYFDTLLPELERAGSPFVLFFETKSNLTRAQVATLRQARVLWIQPGIESLNSELLAHMGKGCQAWENLQLLKWLRRYGIRSSWNMLCDFPEEKEQWYQEMAAMVPLLFHLQPPNGVVPIQFSRFSHYFNERERYRLNLAPSYLFRFTYPTLSAEDRQGQAYVFEEEEWAALRRNPILDLLMGRPATPLLRPLLIEWFTSFWSEGRASLTMRDSAEGLIIEDTRPVAPTPKVVLKGLSRSIYLACDGAVPAAELERDMARLGHGPDEVRRRVQDLLESKLMLGVDGRLLALALDEPVLDLSMDACPLGRIDFERKRLQLS